MKKRIQINEIEFNFSNLCQAKCFICSDFHGDGNVKLMKPEVFDIAVEQLKDVDFERIQTSGNGDALLNPFYFDYLRELRSTFPHAEIHFYSNFYLMTRRVSDLFIEEKLINEIFTRIDSLDASIFEKSTGLKLSIVLQNLEYFIKQNRRIKVNIGYSNIPSYYKLCKRVFNGLPRKNRFSEETIANIPNELERLRRHFGAIPTCGSIVINKINHSLWGERPIAKANPKTPCPKYQILNNIIWISPNGTLSACGYDDHQCDLVYGDITKEHIIDAWNSSKRKEIMDKIKNRFYKEYPCINPDFCRMYPQEL